MEGYPAGAPVPAFQSPITGMYREAPARDDGAHPEQQHAEFHSTSHKTDDEC